MESKKVQVDQVNYDDFEDYTFIDIATMTKWANGEGIDVYIERKHMNDIQISLTDSDISLLRKMFADFDN